MAEPRTLRITWTNLRLVGLFAALAVVGASWVLTCAAWRYSRVVAGFAPLEPRRFPQLAAVLVGTGSAYENPQRRGPCTALGLGSRVWLVDVGRGVAEGLRAAEIPVSQPDTVFLTNLLPENVVGLDDLLHAAWLDSRGEPLRLIGPPGTGALAAGLRGAHHRGLEAAAAGLGVASAPHFEVVEVGGGWESWESVEGWESPDDLEGAGEARDALQVRAAELGGGPTPALAYRFAWRDRSVVVAGTGWAPDALVDLARGVDLLIHEASFSLTEDRAREIGLEETARSRRLLREASLHTSIDAVGSLASRAGVGTLALVRLRPPPVYALQVGTLVGRSFEGRILVPSDGDEIVP